MKTLILMRHAKAAVPRPDQSDFDRPLAPRGQRSAAALGNWLRERGHRPEVALVSAAQRTRETWEGLDIADTTPVRLLRDLYEAAPSGYFSHLAKQDRDSVLIVGHNPTVGLVAEHLLRDQEVPLDLSAYPTGATMVLQMDAPDWTSTNKSPVRLIDWTIPRALDA